jgi:hypothetical protein
MTNNLLIEETLDELIKGMEIDKSTFYKSYKAFSHIHRNREAISFKICIVQKFMCKARIVAESFIEASNKSNIVIL